MRYSEIVRRSVVAGALALLFSASAVAADVTGWHNPLTERTKGPFGTCWTFDRGNIDFGTNALEIKVRYVLKGRNIPKGATEMASLGVDLFDIDNDGGFHLLNGTSDLGKAVGIAVGEGKLSLSEKVAPMFPEEVAEAEKNMTDAQKANLEALTVRHLLIMANGHKKDPTVEYATEYFKKDPFGSLKYIHNEWVDVSGLLTKHDSTLPELFFGYPFDAAPGEKFCYDSFSSCMLSEIITKKTGETMADYLYKRMFKPMGLDRPEWEDIHGVTAGGWGLHLSTDEMLAFGRLLLDGGKWDGQQIIPEDYLKEAVKDQIKDRMNNGQNYSTTGYGYQIRTRSDGSLYMAVGLFGQYIVVIPDKKAVIVMTSAMPFDADNILKDLSKVMALLNGDLDSSVKPLELAWKYIVPEL